MLNRRRLTRLGRFWLDLLHLTTILFVIGLVAGLWMAVSPYVLGAGPRMPQPSPSLALTLERVAAVLGGIFGAWSNVAIVLGVLVWSESSVLSPQEEAGWDEIDRDRRQRK